MLSILPGMSANLDCRCVAIAPPPNVDSRDDKEGRLELGAGLRPDISRFN